MYKGEKEIITLLKEKKQMNVAEISKLLSMNPDMVRRAAESLKAKGFVKVDSKEEMALQATEEYERYSKTGFPEYTVYLKSLSSVSIDSLSPDEKSIGIRWARAKGFVGIDSGKLKPLKEKNDVLAEMKKLSDAFAAIRSGGKWDKVIEEELFRRHFVEKTAVRETVLSYTGKPLKEFEAESEFDPNIAAADAETGLQHPISKITCRVKSIMTELGFEEMEGTLLESAFWNFDALFQPQDHPARELADTFYVDMESPLPSDKALVARVKKTHEDGWKQPWKEEVARKTVLRTHTTALSVRYLAKIKDKKPRKYFAVGRVFRNEATDYKHLAEFHQIDGIVIWENATFCDLLGVLKEIYKKLGFEKIRFRPSYFPYTEPSLEVEVFYEDKKQWMELGGAGIFRPEVSIPLCGVYPVLAWGLSLERPLMLSLELNDIREFYKNDLEFLKDTAKRKL